jgi:HAD superfamily hydrolase (TIGR01549 family)
MIKAIIFDFDGVILESAIIKTQAFAEVVKDYPKEQADAFVEHHMTHMGISRHVKFKYFIEEILHEPYTDDKEKRLADDFERIVFEQVMKCPFVPGAKEFLEKNYDKYDLYIASGTPEEEMNRVIEGRSLKKYFKEVYGSPAKKPDIIREILKKDGLNKSEAIFVGDAGTDMKAAEETGLVFVGRNTSENKDIFRNVRYKVDSLLQIEDIIGELNDI